MNNIRIYQTEKGFYVADPENKVLVGNNVLYGTPSEVVVRVPGLSWADFQKQHGSVQQRRFFTRSNRIYQAGHSITTLPLSTGLTHFFDSQGEKIIRQSTIATEHYEEGIQRWLPRMQEYSATIEKLRQRHVQRLEKARVKLEERLQREVKTAGSPELSLLTLLCEWR